MNFKIQNLGPVSESYLNHGVKSFQEAIIYTRNLPYKRNKNKVDITCVLDEHGGTCSTKHAALYNLAQENGEYDIKLILAIIRMNSKNTPKVKAILEKNKLEYFPEAHNYLKLGNDIIDATAPGYTAKSFTSDILEEIEIEPYQITDFKVQYQKAYILKWLSQNPEIKYTPEKIWKIREDCIRALSE